MNDLDQLEVNHVFNDLDQLDLPGARLTSQEIMHVLHGPDLTCTILSPPPPATIEPASYRVNLSGVREVDPPNQNVSVQETEPSIQKLLTRLGLTGAQCIKMSTPEKNRLFKRKRLGPEERKLVTQWRRTHLNRGYAARDGNF